MRILLDINMEIRRGILFIRLIGKLFDKANQAELLIRNIENNIIHINSMSNVSEKGVF